VKLIFFSSNRCPVCAPLKKKLEKLADEMKLEFKEVKIEENPQEAAQRLIFSAPAVVLEENGREVGRWSGVFSVEQVRRKIESGGRRPRKG